MGNNKVKILLTFIMLAATVSATAQSEQFLWETHGTGYGLEQRSFDNYGNMYVAGRFESLATLAGQLICPADTNEWLMSAIGVFIAKFDTAGTLLWCRSVKGWKEGTCSLCGFSIRGDSISFVFLYRTENLLIPWDPYHLNRHAWLHFIDTTYYSEIDGVVQPYGTLPFRNADIHTYLVTLDLDGNRLNTFKTAYYLRGSYRQDSRGNHYFLHDEPIRRTAGDSSVYITLGDQNDSTAARFYYPGNKNNYYPLGNSYRYTPFLIKVNREWTNIDIFQLTDSVNGFVNAAGDSVFSVSYYEYTFHCFTNDDEDNFYITASSLCERYSLKTSYPLEMKFNNGSSILQEIDNTLDFILKVDTSGNVKWAQQFHYEKCWNSRTGSDMSLPNYTGGLFIDSAHVYYAGCFQEPDRWYFEDYPDLDTDSIAHVYFDREHLIRLTVPNPKQFFIAAIVTYDKNTGEYVSHISLPADSVGTQTGSGNRPYVTDDYFITNASTRYQLNCTYRYNRHTGELDVYDTIVSSYTLCGNKGLCVSEYGFLTKGIAPGGNALTSPNFYIPPSNGYLLFYYDSILDKRRQRPHDPVGIERPLPTAPTVCISPNPTSGIVTVNSAENINLIEIYDTEGRLLESRNFDNPHLRLSSAPRLKNLKFFTLDIGYYPKGTYLIKVCTDTGQTTEKVVKN